MSAARSDADLLWRACETLNAAAAALKGRAAFRLGQAAPEDAARLDRIAALVERAHDAAEAEASALGLKAALALRRFP